MQARVDVIFDVPEGSRYHRPTIDAVRHAADSLGVATNIEVVRSDTIDDTYFEAVPDAVVIGPGTPYAAPPSVERVIAVARDRGIPLVGT